MIKVLRAYESPPLVEGVGATTLGIEIEIDGFIHSVGGLNPSWTRDELMTHLNSRYDELLTNARQASLDIINIKARDDLCSTYEDTLKVEELLANSPPVITLSEIWKLLRIFGKKLGYKER